MGGWTGVWLGMPPPRGASFSHDALLDAAEAVIHEEGIGNLTLDAVAARARVSKGGLLHHFPTKEKLLEAMVRRIVDSWYRNAIAAIGGMQPRPGRVVRGVMSLCLDRADCGNETLHRSSFVLVTALVNNPKLVQPLRDVHRELQKQAARDGLPPGVGESVLLALDGLWFEQIFGLHEMTALRRAKISSALHRFLEMSRASEQSRQRRASVRRKRRINTRKATP
ncbi:hypothetical protein PHYC_00452 [Phycisphaerales bacterium]|nr:hypothetical protein PHYC_00452 [Phycisphaerales bacterium]